MPRRESTHSAGEGAAEASGAAARNDAADTASDMVAASSAIFFLIILSLFVRPVFSDFAATKDAMKLEAQLDMAV